VHCLDAFFDRVNILLWPRFKIILDMHVESVQKVKANSVKKDSILPHYVTTRYAEFCGAILKLNREYNDDFLLSNLRRLRNEVDKLLERAAGRVALPKNQVIFLINNYNVILRILQDKGLVCEEIGSFEEKAKSQVALFVEEELSEKFGRLITFVKNTEMMVTKMTDDSTPLEAKIDSVNVESIVRHFAKFWREGIEHINTSVRNNFRTNSYEGAMGAADLRIGTEILKQAAIQLMLYYQRFDDLLRKCYKNKSPPFLKEMVPISTIMYEIKKYGREREDQ